MDSRLRPTLNGAKFSVEQEALKNTHTQFLKYFIAIGHIFNHTENQNEL